MHNVAHGWKSKRKVLQRCYYHNWADPLKRKRCWTSRKETIVPRFLVILCSRISEAEKDSLFISISKSCSTKFFNARFWSNISVCFSPSWLWNHISFKQSKSVKWKVRKTIFKTCLHFHPGFGFSLTFSHSVPVKQTRTEKSYACILSLKWHWFAPDNGKDGSN